MADVADLEEALRTRVTEIVSNASQATMEATRDAAPIGKTEGLRDSHAVDPPVDGGSVFSADLHADAPYAEMVAEGTVPHIIRPVSRKVLHFEAGGDEVFTTIVHHPGTRPRPEWWSEDAIGARWTSALDNEVS